jgi:Bacterial sugar transferase
MLVEDDQGRNTLHGDAMTHIGVAISSVYRTARDMKLAEQLWYILSPGKGSGACCCCVGWLSRLCLRLSVWVSGGSVSKLSVDELQNLRCVLTPRIFGLAQVNGCGLLNCDETLASDLQYVRTRSVSLNLKVIAITLKHVTRHGAFSRRRTEPPKA